MGVYWNNLAQSRIYHKKNIQQRVLPPVLRVPRWFFISLHKTLWCHRWRAAYFSSGTSTLQTDQPWTRPTSKRWVSRRPNPSKVALSPSASRRFPHPPPRIEANDWSPGLSSTTPQRTKISTSRMHKPPRTYRRLRSRSWMAARRAVSL